LLFVRLIISPTVIVMFVVIFKIISTENTIVPPTNSSPVVSLCRSQQFYGPSTTLRDYICN